VKSEYTRKVLNIIGFKKVKRTNKSALIIPIRNGCKKMNKMKIFQHSALTKMRVKIEKLQKNIQFIHNRVKKKNYNRKNKIA